MPTLLRDASPVARKRHYCDTCRVGIEPGQRYHRAVYLGDDGLYEWVCCLPCNELTGVVWSWAGQPWEGVTDEDFIEWAREAADDPRAAAFTARRARGAR